MKKKLLLVFMIALAIFMTTGCDKKKNEKKKEESPIPTIDPVDEPDPNAPNVSVEEKDAHSDDNKIVFKDKDTIFVFYFEGNKVIAFHQIIDMETAEMAQDLAKGLKDSQNIRSITTEGQYVLIENKSGTYKNMMTSDVRLVYQDLEEVKG